MGDYDDELVFYGDIAEERCAVCRKPAGTIDDVLYAWSWERWDGVPVVEFLHHKTCMYNDYRDEAGNITGALDWDEISMAPLIDEQELERRRARFDLQELRPVCRVPCPTSECGPAQEVTIMQSPRGTIAYMLASDDEICIRRLLPGTTDEFEQSLLARIDATGTDERESASQH